MVKRWEKMGRKPILQFDDNKTNSSQPSSSGNNLRGLIHYDDSEDSSGSGQDEESCVSSAGETAPKETKQLDLEVADFFKEIDAMTTNDAQDTSEAEAKSDENEALDKDSIVVLNHSDQANSSVSTNVPESCSWQQCYDETSGYTYFWNTQTNEVTWESPLEYKEYLERIQAKETAKKVDQNHSGSLYVTNGEASTSSAGRVTINGGGSSSSFSFKNSSKPPKKRAHNLIEGKIEPITIFGPSTSDSSDEESSAKAKKKKVIVNQPELRYGPYLPEQPISIADNSISEVDRLSSNSTNNEEKSNEVTVSESFHPSSSSNGVEVRAEYAMDLTRGPVTQSTENGRSPPEIQVDNVSDSEVQNSEDNFCEPELMSEASVSQPSTSSEGLHHSHSDHSSGFCPNEDEPDSTCTSKLERHFRKSKSSRQVGCSLPQSLQFLSQYEVSDGDSDRETPELSPFELSAKSSPVNNAEVEELLERNQLEQASNSTESDVVSGPAIDSEESSPNNRVSDSEARVVPISSPENMEDQPSGSQDDEIDLDEIEKELDRALERKACESSRNNDSPRPSGPSEENAQSVPGDNSPEAGPSLSQEELELFSSDIIGKLELLTTNRAQIQLLSTLLIMVDVRLTDWRNGALPSYYFMNRLREANDVLKQYEDSAVPIGWTCNWDRNERRYFYTSVQTGRSQTEFPVESVEENSPNVVENQNEQPRTPITYESILSGTHSSAGQHPVVTSSTAEGLFRSVAKNTNRTGPSVSMVQSGEASCSFQTSSASSNREETVQALIELPIETPPPPTSPPPSIPPLPKSPPPSPPDSTDAGDIRQVPNRAMHIDNPGPDHPLSSSHALSQPNCQIPPLVPLGLPVIGSLPNVPNALEQQQMAFYESLGNSWMPQPSVASEATQPGVIIVRPPLSNGIEVAGYPAPAIQWPIAAQQPPPEPFYYIPEANGVANLEANIVPSPVNGDVEEAANSSVSVEIHIDPLMAIPAGPSNAGTSNEPQNPPRKDKKKSKLSTGLSLKKKNISSLVQKWQKIKKEQLREEEEVEGRKNTDQDGKISTTM